MKLTSCLKNAILLLLIAFVVTGCAKKAPLRIGLNIWPGYEFIYLAQHLGYYEQEGVDVQIVDFSSLADARRSFERGEIDGLGTTVVEVLMAAENTQDTLKIVNAVDYSDGADVIIAKNGITDIKSLKGKKVGVELGSICVYVLGRALEQAGMSLRDIIPISRDQASMEAELREGQLDAVVTYPPTSTLLQRDGIGQIIFTSAAVPREIVDVIALGQKTIDSRTDDVAAFLRAFNRAKAYALQNPQEAYRVMGEREHLTPEEFGASLNDGMKLISETEQQHYVKNGGLKPVIARTAELLSQLGLITQPQPAETYIDARFYP